MITTLLKQKKGSPRGRHIIGLPILCINLCVGIFAIMIIPLAHGQTLVYQAPPDARQEVINRIIHFAHIYQIEDKIVAMYRTVECESRFDSLAIGDGGNSIGLSQIHLPSWPDITKEMAYDPDFAVSFMAQRFSENKERLWTCWRLLHSQGRV